MTFITAADFNTYFNLGTQSIKSIEACGTNVQRLVPASTALYSLWKEDYEGFAYMAVALVVNQLAIEVLKYLTHVTRPSGGPGSFPSGHTMATALGAAFLIKRYGIRNIPIAFSIISCTSIGLVGASRFIANAHWISDIAAGAIFGSLIGCAVPSLT